MPNVTETTNVLLPFRSQAKSVSRVVLAFYLLSPNVLLADALISAASNNGPEFVTSANGTTVVNINKATAGGVSRNDYNTFNVSDKGLILNNSANIVNTTLAGHIDGNARLQGNSASIILNEVLGGSASNLNGYTEVAGQAAEVIIANQSGITCNGCGFINTTRGVLTTGQLQFEANNFSGYNVTQGQISIEGEGLNAANIDQVDLLARSISLNGKVWADKLNAITGQNTIAHDNLEILSSTSSVDNQPGFSLDVSALGGMYANRINLIGTEDGLGVNSAGDLVAIDQLQINQSGKITNTGSVAANQVTITATDFRNSEDGIMLIAKSDLNVKNNFNNQGVIKGQDVVITAKDVTNTSDATVYMTGSIDINATGSFINSNALIQSGGDSAITASVFTNTDSSMISSLNSDLIIQANALSNTAVLSGNNTIITSNSFSNSGENAQIQAGNDLTITVNNAGILNGNSATLYAASNLTLNNTGYTLNNRANIQSDNHLNINAQVLDNNSKGIIASGSGELNIQVSDLNNTAILAGTSVFINTDTFNNSGSDAKIQAVESLTITASDTIYNNDGAFIYSVGDATLASDAYIYNQSSVIEAGGKLSLTAQQIENKQYSGGGHSYLVSAGDMALSGNLRNENSILYSLSDLYQSNGSFYNDAGGIFKVKNGTADINATTWNNSGFIAASTLDVTANTITNNGESALVLAYEYLDMSTALGDLNNLDGGVLYSFNDARFDVFGRLLNEASYIETVESLSISAKDITNQRDEFTVAYPTKTTDSATNKTINRLDLPNPPGSGSFWYANITYVEKTKTPYVTEAGTQGVILSGADMTLTATEDITNDYSTISSYGDMVINANNLDNNDRTETISVTTTGTYYWGTWTDCHSYESCGHKNRTNYNQDFEDVSFSTKNLASATLTANGTVTGNVKGDVANGSGKSVSDRSNEDQDITDPNSQLADTSANAIDLSGQTLDDLSNSALFSQTNNSEHNYLIETNPNFIEYENFISSDYMLEKMGVDINDSVNTRLGDGYFEQDQVRDQILELTGTQYLDENQNTQDQYLNLMESGIAAQQDFNLSVGVALTVEQIQALNQPIVWMVEQEFETENGVQTALVPQVYFSDAMAMLLRKDGALIGGDSVDLQVEGNLANSGIISANEKLALSAENIISSGTLKAVKNISLVAQQNITNKSGLIDGGNISIDAGNDFINVTNIDVLTLGNGDDYSAKKSIVGNTATINADNLSISARNDIQLIGSALKVENDLVLQAANNIEMTTVKIIEEAINGNYYNVSSVEHITTDIGAGTVLMLAGNTFTSEGATINATGDMSVSAKDINLLAVKNTEDKDIFNNYGGGNTNHTVSHTEAVVATQFNSAGVLSLNSSNRILSKGSQLSGTNGIDLAAGGDITLATEQAYNSSTVTTTSKKSGTFSSTRKTSTQKDESLTHTGTSLASDGHINMTSGNNITLTGSDLESGGNVELNAKGDVSLLAAVNDSFTQFTQTVKKTFTQKAKDSGSINQEAVGSHLTAQGNLTINSGGNTTIKGSDLTTAQTLTLGDQAVTKDENGNYINADGQQVGNVTVTTQALTNETWDKSSSGLRGVLADVASGLTTITASIGIETEIEVGRSSEDLTQDTTQQASNILAQDLNIDTSGNVAIIGSNVSVNDSASINANSLTIDAAKEQHTDSHASTKKTVSSAGASMGETEVSLLSLSETETTTTTTNQSTTWAGSTLEAGNLSVNVKETAAIISSDVNVEGEASIQAQDVLIGGRQDIATTTTDTETKTKTLTIGVKNAYADTVFAIDALNDAKNAVRDAKSAYNDAKQKIANGQMPASELKYFETNIAAATVNVANATIALASAGAAAATSSGTAGFYATGTASTQVDKSSSTDTSNTWNGSSLNINGNANINAENEIKVKGSNVAVAGALQLDAEHINLLAGDNSTQSNSESSSHTESASVSIKAPDAGGTNFSGSLNASKTEGSSESQYYTNTQIVAGTLSSDSKNLTLSGANVDAGVVDITTENLLVESLQNTATSNSETVGINAGFGKDGPSSAGINQQESNTSSAWVDQQSGITGGNVNITAKDTTLKGGLIAAIDQDGNDNGNLSLTTDTLSVENIQDHDTSSDKGINLSHSFDGTNAHEKNNPPKASSDKMSTASTTIGGNYNGHDTRQTTSATLGNGNVKVGGQDIADTNIEVNRDVENAQEITQDHQLGGLDASVTVDHRLVSEEGRKSIKKDIVDTTQHAKEIGQAIDDLTSTDIGLVDGIKNVDKYAKDRIVLADKAMSEDAQKALKGEEGAEGSENELQQLSDALSKEEGLAENTDINLYDGSQTPDDTPVESANDFNKEIAKAGYHENGEQGGNDVYLNIDKTDMTDSSDVVKSLVHEQERHSQAQNNSSLSDTDQTTLATNRGSQAQDTFNAYSDLAGIDTKSTTATQKDWNTTNRSSQNVVDATEQMRARVQSEEVKPLLPKFVENARQAVLDHQEESQQASANLKGNGIGASLSVAAGVGDMVIGVADIAVTAVDKVTDAIGALGVLGENLQQEAIGNIKDDIAALENAYENKEQIANAILESLEQFPERLADMDPSAIRSLVAVLGEAAIPVGILVKANKVDVPDTPKVDMAIADNEVSHSTLDQDPVVQALREKDRQSIDPNSSDISVDNEMIGQDGPTYDGIIEPEKFDATALEGQKRQQQMLDDNTGYNVSSAADEISYPNSTIGGAGTYITDRQAFESSLGSLPENGGVVQVTREQIDTLEGSVGLRPGSLEDGSVIRQINNLDTTSPSSPVGPAGGPPGNEYFRGTGMHLPDGSPEIISEAQSRVNNPNIGSNWTIEVID